MCHHYENDELTEWEHLHEQADEPSEESVDADESDLDREEREPATPPADD